MGRPVPDAQLLRHFPRARRIQGDEAHFPLVADGTGIRATVFLQPLGLLRVGSAPETRGAPKRQSPLSPRHPTPSL